MVDQATLSLSIDASGAKQGAAQFSRAADDIKNKAAEMGRALDRGSQAFRGMQAAANDNSRALNSSVRSLRDAESVLRGLGDAAASTRDRMRELQSSSDQASRSLFDKFGKEIRSFSDLIIELGVKFGVSAESMSKVVTAVEGMIAAFGAFQFGKTILKSAQLATIFARLAPIIAAVTAGVGALVAAIGGGPLLVFAGVVAAATVAFFAFRGETSRARQDLDTFNGVIKQSGDLLKEAAENGELVSNERREVVTKQLEGRLQGLLKERQKIAERIAKNGVKLDELGDSRRAKPLRALIDAEENRVRRITENINTLQGELDKLNALSVSDTPETTPTPTFGSGPSQGDGNDGERLNHLIEDTIRSIELLKEQKQALKINAASATAQKEQELELLQREKECLERLNEALQDNQTLRGITGDQSDDVLEGAAAYDDLSTAVDENGEAARGLKDQVDSLNTVLQLNADINTQIVGGLEKERDKRHQVNDMIVERRQLEEEQKQRLIDAEDETERRGKAVEASIEQIKDAAADSFKDVIKGTESIGDAFQKLADRITDILLDLALDELLKGGTGFSYLFGTVFGGIGSIFGGGAPANLAGPAGVGILPFGHQGGVIGRDRFPLRRFHQGGFPGLRPDEIPIIAQRGEEILARGDPRNAANNNGAAGGNVVINVSFPNARNTQEARQAGSEIAAKAAAAAQRGMVRKGIG